MQLFFTKVNHYFFYNMFSSLYICVWFRSSWHLTHRGKALSLHESIISLRGEVWIHKTSLMRPLVIEVHVLSQKSERSCICVLEVSIWSLSVVLIIYFGLVPTEWFDFFIPIFTTRLRYFWCSWVVYITYKTKV